MKERMLYLCRHGDTPWSAERRLAGRKDLPLAAHGEENARQLGRRLAGISFQRVLVSPLARARRTAELAGLAAAAEIDERLLEMDFGRYEGRTVEEIRAERPGWTYLRDGCPGGEGPEDLRRRVDAVLEELGAATGNVVLFAHSVTLRVLAARFLGLPPEAGAMFMLAPGALSILGYDHVGDARAIASWNDRQHLSGQSAFA
jgi:probable phosphoglycerate mutase